VLADRLTIEKTDGPAGTVEFTCDDPTVPGDETNLAVKALRALEEHTGTLPPVRLHLEKRVPHGAGLGGGSSDAAAVLTGINELFALNLTTEVLHTAAAAVGSDVPFFLYGKVCDCTGRGEIVTPVPDFSWHPRLLLIKPPFGIATAGVYRNWKDSREVPGLPYAAQGTPFGELINDLERPVFEKYPVLGTLKARLLATPGVTAALMSGSGSTVFAVLEPDADAAPAIAAAQQEIGTEGWFFETALPRATHE
jgi:4-diphosphocytidyl-2-C-methyl-D-erythritol kinase